MNIFDIKIKKVFKSAQRNFELDVSWKSDNNCIILFGPSGIGKTSTIKAIAGLIQPDTGHIIVKNRTLFDKQQGINLKIQQRNLAYLFQDYALFPHLTVLGNVGFSLTKAWYNKLNSTQTEQAYYWLNKFKIGELAMQYPSSLSGGQQQRVALARALINQPSLLLLDEPFSALDHQLREQMHLEIKLLQDELNIPMILITHDKEDLTAFDAEVIQFA